MTEFQIKEDGRTMIPSVFSHAGKKELVLLQYPQLQALDMVKHCFTTRMGGVSKNEFSSLDLSFNRGDDIEAVKENFRRVAEAMEVPAGQIVCSDQTHTTNVPGMRSARFAATRRRQLRFRLPAPQQNRPILRKPTRTPAQKARKPVTTAI